MKLLMCLLFAAPGILAQNLYQEQYLKSGTVNGVKNTLEDIRGPQLDRLGPRQINIGNLPVGAVQTYDQRYQEKTTETKKNQYTQDSEQSLQTNENNKDYIRKMANQLLSARDHVTFLSDHQRHILNQDPLVQKYVFGGLEQSTGVANEKRSRSKQKNRNVNFDSSENLKPDQKSLVIMKKNYNAVLKTPPNKQASKYKQANNGDDHSSEASEYRYITLPPPTLRAYDPTPKIQVVPSPQPYYIYNVEESPKHNVQVIPVSNSLNQETKAYYPHPAYNEYSSVNHEEQHHDPPKYQFMYKVNDYNKDNHFGHMESRSDDATYGHYFVQLPDGRLETVNYWADKTGYHAKVEFQGRAIHPHH